MFRTSEMVNHFGSVLPAIFSSANIKIILEACGHVKYYTKGAKDSLKLLLSHLPKESNYYKLVQCAFEAASCTTTVLSGINNLTGATGTTGAATAAEVFGFPSPQPSSSGAKRKRFTAPVAPKSQTLVEESTASTSFAIGQNVPGEEEEPELTFQMGDKDNSPDITVKLHEELKHGSEQCFCGKGDLKTQEDKDSHYKKAHFQKGRGINPKTGKKNNLWACSTCNKVCKDNRAVWKHFRTQHLNLYIHYCPIEGCNIGNDQKDSIVSHILRDHKNKEWVEKCYQQKWLICPRCLKFFMSVKGKHSHISTCGKPKMKINCPYEHCFKTYTTEEALDQHVQTTHKGKAHRCLCPHCGVPFSSKQALDSHIAKEHSPDD